MLLHSAQWADSLSVKLTSSGLKWTAKIFRWSNREVRLVLALWLYSFCIRYGSKFLHWINLVNIPRKNSKDVFLWNNLVKEIKLVVIVEISSKHYVSAHTNNSWPALAPPSQRNSHRRQQWLAVDPTDLVSSAGSRDCPACLGIWRILRPGLFFHRTNVSTWPFHLNQIPILPWSPWKHCPRRSKPILMRY